MLFSWSERLREPGDYVTGTLAGYPVFVLRDDAGRVRAFHNVCRHRGAQLLTEEHGRCGKLVVCPYHSWSYTRDGRLNKAVDFGSDTAFDPDAWGLYAIEAEEWRGLVFLRLKRGGPGLREWLGPIDAMAADYPLESQHYFSSKDRDCAVDWKTYGENYLECYHCRTMHPGLCAAMDIDNYRIDTYPEQKFFHLHAPKRDGRADTRPLLLPLPVPHAEPLRLGQLHRHDRAAGPGPHPPRQLVFLHRRLAREGRGEPPLRRLVGRDRLRRPRHHHGRAAQPRQALRRGRVANTNA